ncbi:MAG: hypothetical protein HC860_06610 [Alkalinema sp. RU_4_3]|nr:hypothetical protein [Alkalinema sp. RU_4_3]
MSPADLSLNPASLKLNYSDRYRCPLCQHGTLSSLILMDVFACDFCRHMFTANLENQVLRVEDSLQNLAWRWNGSAGSALARVTAVSPVSCGAFVSAS